MWLDFKLIRFFVDRLGKTHWDHHYLRAQTWNKSSSSLRGANRIHPWQASRCSHWRHWNHTPREKGEFPAQRGRKPMLVCEQLGDGMVPRDLAELITWRCNLKFTVTSLFDWKWNSPWPDCFRLLKPFQTYNNLFLRITSYLLLTHKFLSPGRSSTNLYKALETSYLWNLFEPLQTSDNLWQPLTTSKYLLPKWEGVAFPPLPT